MMSWVPASMAGATVLMVVILCIRQKVADWFGAEWAYALWLLPLLRTILPPLPQSASPVPIVVLLPAHAPPPSVAAAASAAPGFDWLGLLLAIWLGGAVLFLCWQQSAYGAFLLHLGPSGKKAEPPLFGGIKVIESTAVDGPVAVGFFRRRIVVPLDFSTRYTKAEQRLALEHELIHHQRFDLVWNFLALVLLALNWFNPVAHLAFKAFRADQELSCDALVARRAPGQRRDYAHALVKSASSVGLIAVAPLNHAAFLKRRLKMMNMHRSSRLRLAGGAAAFMMTSAAALMIATASSARAPAAADGSVIVAAPGQAPLVLKDGKVHRFAKACDRIGNSDQVIVCRNGQLTNDPEVRAEVERAMREAKVEIAKIRPEQMREVRMAMQQADAALSDPEVQRQLAEAEHTAVNAHAIAAHAVASTRVVRTTAVRDAIEQARVQLANSDWKEMKLAALRSVEESLHASHASLDADQREAVEDALREAREQIQSIDFSEDLRAAQEELKQAEQEAAVEE